MKIGFIGTGGTGKTTLLNSLSPLWEKHGIVKLPFEMREVLHRYNITNELDMCGLGRNDLADVQYTGINNRINAEADYMLSDWVSDRTLLDHWLYIISWLGSPDITNSGYDYYAPLICKSLREYDALFYFPQDVFHNPDGIRLKNKMYHEVFNTLAQHYLNSWGIAYSYVVYSKLSERKTYVEAIVEKVMAHGSSSS